jgi:hypothetical protein
MTKAVLEAESEGAAQRTVAVVPSPALAVPASLHASLMARLDRLGPAKEVAQIGAAMGRGFSHALLASVVRKPESELVSAINRVLEVGLLSRQGVPPHASYLFKHALVQDAANVTNVHKTAAAEDFLKKGVRPTPVCTPVRGDFVRGWLPRELAAPIVLPVVGLGHVRANKLKNVLAEFRWCRDCSTILRDYAIKHRFCRLPRKAIS